jgi:tRNA U34 5-carboxymethylaminomethyl modifying GTPase MnmE/TrmE
LFFCCVLRRLFGRCSPGAALAEALAAELGIGDDALPPVADGATHGCGRSELIRAASHSADPDVSSGGSVERYLQEQRLRARATRTVVLVGPTGHGKSSCGNLLLRRRAFRCGRSASSVTDVSASAASQDGALAVTDTVGLFDTTKTHAEVMGEMGRVVALAPGGVHAVLLVFRAERFTDEARRALDALAALFGDAFWRHAVAVFTHGDLLLDAEADEQEDAATAATVHDSGDGAGVGDDNEAALSAAFEKFASVTSAPEALRSYLERVGGVGGGRCVILDNSRRAPAASKVTGRAQLLAAVERTVAANGGEAFTGGIFNVAQQAAAAAAAAYEPQHSQPSSWAANQPDISRVVDEHVRAAVERAVEARLAELEAGVRALQAQVNEEKNHRAALEAQGAEYRAAYEQSQAELERLQRALDERAQTQARNIFEHLGCAVM